MKNLPFFQPWTLVLPQVGSANLARPAIGFLG